MATPSFPFRLVASLSLALVASGAAACAAPTDEDESADTSSEEALVAGCALGDGCAAVTSILPAVAPTPGPTASKQNATYWAPDATAGRNVPRVAKTASLTGLRLDRDDVSVWLSSTDDATGPLAADDVLLVEVRGSSGSVLARQVLVGPRLLLADKTTEVPTRPSAWNAALAGASAPAFDLTPLLPRGRSFTLKVSVLDLVGQTANAAVKLVTRPRVTPPPPPPPPPPVARAIADAFDVQAQAALPGAVTSDLVRFFAPGASTSRAFKTVLVERRRVMNYVTGYTPWEARLNTTLNSEMWTLPEVASLPFGFAIGQVNKGHLTKLATARAWNITNTLFYSTNVTGYTSTECVNAVSRGSSETCFYFPYAQLKVTADGVWAVSNTSRERYGADAVEERQFAVVGRFDAQQVPVARFENATWSVSW